MNTLKIKRGDRIIVIAGDSKDKGKKAKVLEANPEKNTVIVDGVNIQKRHKKAKNQQELGGIISNPGPINVSNVMMICPACGKPTRVGYSIDENGKKNRICKGCNANLDTKAKEKPAKKDKKSEEKAIKSEEKAAKPKKVKKEKSEE